MKTDNYYDAFVSSILSIEPKLRNVLLKAAAAVVPEQFPEYQENPMFYLWRCYSDLDNELGQFIKALLDEYKLAID